MSSPTRQLAFVTPQYFDSDSYLGGGERYPLNLARGIVGATGGHSAVRIVSFGPVSREVEIDDGVNLCVLPLAFTPVHPMNVVAWDLVDVLQDVDIIHAHQVFTRAGEAAILIGSILDKPVFATDLGAHASTLGMRYGMLELIAGVICISEFSARMIETASPVTVIRGGVDTEAFTPPTKPGHRGHVLYVGRLLPHKGIDNLILAMPDDLPLYVCGVPYDRTYEQHLRSLAAGRTVEFIAEADDAQLVHLYRGAIATVLPSVYRDHKGGYQRAPELMGLTLLEAMACGTPAICSRVGGMPEFIRDGETGFVFDTIDELRALISRLRRGDLSADQVGANARRVAVAEYDIRHVGRAVSDLYEAALTNAG